MVIGLLAALQLGFNFSRHSIPLSEILDGGPPKDGIPALSDPEFVTGDEATFLNPLDRILGFFVDEEAKAYPISILNWHELVNDRVGGKSILVSYCRFICTDTLCQARLDFPCFRISDKVKQHVISNHNQETVKSFVSG